jgi:EpsD family peptidyl-prolyl cis-trans isomerase
MSRSIRAIAYLMSLLLAGCGARGDKPATQVAARVNSEEITVHQINYLLARTPNVTPENAERVKRTILDKLIDEELVRQQAVKDKLDRSPDVVQAMEFARTEVLARSYLRGIAATQPKPTDDEVKRYYAGHPELFSERRVFNVDEIVFDATEDLEGALRDEAAKARSLQDIAAWLKARGIKFAEDRAVRAAEQVPLDVLPRLQSMKDGQIELVGVDKGRFHLVQVVASKTMPVDERAAAPRIREFLFNQRVSAAVADEMKRVKQQSKIEYMGEFAASPARDEPQVESAPRPAAEAATSDLINRVKGLFE